MKSLGLCLGTPFKLKGLRFITITECGNSVGTEWTSLPLTNFTYEDVEQERQHEKSNFSSDTGTEEEQKSIWKWTLGYILVLTTLAISTAAVNINVSPVTCASHWAQSFVAMNHEAVGTSYTVRLEHGDLLYSQTHVFK